MPRRSQVTLLSLAGAARLVSLWGPRATLALALPLAGCQQVLGIEPPEAVDESCAGCQAQRCSAELRSCESSAPCGARLECSRACPADDYVCATDCAIERAGPSYDAFSALRACEASRCSESCNVSCGDMPVVIPADAANTCRSCLDSRCCETATTCLGDPVCVGIAECIRAQSTPDEVQQCLQGESTQVAPAYVALETCLNTYCTQDCALGSSWTCLGRVTWPTAVSPTIQVGVRAVENQGVAGIQGLVVQACGLSDAACSKPIDLDTTDQGGFALLDVSATSMSGFVGFTGFVRLTDPNGTRMPTMAFANPPITRDGTVRDIPIGTQKLTAELADMGNVALKSGRGHVALSLRDCAARPATGVSLALSVKDEFTAVRYARGFGLSESATATDKYGTAFVFNALAKPLTITATLEDGRTVGVANVQIVDGWITEVTLSPTP